VRSITAIVVVSSDTFGIDPEVITTKNGIMVWKDSAELKHHP
jgi:hypothetical protein